MRRMFVILALVSGCSQKAHQATLPNYAHFRAVPSLAQNAYAVDVLTGDDGGTLLFMAVPTDADSNATIQKTEISPTVKAELMRDFAALIALRPPKQFCTDGTQYTSVLQSDDAAVANVTNSCDPAAQQLASRIHTIVKSTIGETVPKSANWFPSK